MSRLSRLEENILNRLDPLKDRGLELLNSPVRCRGRAIATAYFYMTSDNGEQLEATTQKGSTTISFGVQLCDMRSHKQIYPYLEAIKLLLNWYVPDIEGFGEIKFNSIGYSPYEDKDGIKWVYEMTFSVVTLVKKQRTPLLKIEELFI
ncbi:hypothetical protein [Okeania sp. SIO2B9]|uniref:hypothetical protein n=1 Tax=Okeania sp. SIO2B9 TaxID=2607782 RepID=UPI001428FE8A|nr:hypothetical protein [Okeania sp. SIO2B9]NES91868.1 hypothetical protein [Okeania sp. SIO2B9]